MTVLRGCSRRSVSQAGPPQPRRHRQPRAAQDDMAAAFESPTACTPPGSPPATEVPRTGLVTLREFGWANPLKRLVWCPPAPAAQRNDLAERYIFHLTPAEEWARSADRRRSAAKRSFDVLFLPGLTEKLIIYFHGNADNLYTVHGPLEELMQQLCCSILAVEYPGYQRANRTPTRDEQAAFSFEGVSDRARFVFDVARGKFDGNAAAEAPVIRPPGSRPASRQGFRREDIFIFGRSLGTGPAARLAAELSLEWERGGKRKVAARSRNPFGGLILQSPYTTLNAVGAGFLSRKWHPFHIKDAWYGWNNCDSLEHTALELPVLILYSSDDLLIPPEQSAFLLHTRREKIRAFPGNDHAALERFNQLNEILVEKLFQKIGHNDFEPTRHLVPELQNFMRTVERYYGAGAGQAATAQPSIQAPLSPEPPEHAQVQSTPPVNRASVDNAPAPKPGLQNGQVSLFELQRRYDEQKAAEAAAAKGAAAEPPAFPDQPTYTESSYLQAVPLQNWTPSTRDSSRPVSPSQYTPPFTS